MPVAVPAYLLRRGDNFYFRRVIPRPLRHRFGRDEIKLSLKTRDRGLARIA